MFGALKAASVLPVPSGTAFVGRPLFWCLNASAVVEVVAFIARSASTELIVRGTLIGDGHADTVVVENPVLRALEADLVFPVPGATTDVGGLPLRGFDAPSEVKVVAFIARSAGTEFVVRGALIRDIDAATVGSEDVLLGALEADLVLPVPAGTTLIRHLLNGGFNATTVLQSVAFVAAGTCTVAVMTGTLVRDGHTDALRVENPLFRTLKTELSVPVPLSAANIGGPFIPCRHGADTVAQVVSLVARETGSVVVVPGGAEVADGVAHLVVVKVVPLGALNTDGHVLVPEGAAGIRGFGYGRLLAATVVESVASVAAETEAVKRVVGLALIADGLALVVGIEIGTLSALDAGIARPSGAEGVFTFGGEGVLIDQALVAVEHVPAVASQTGASLVPGPAVIRHRHADTLVIEDPSP